MFIWHILYFIQIISFVLGQFARPSWRNLSAKRINEACEESEECQKSDFNSICDKMRWEPVCKCSPGLSLIADKCVKECQDDSDCQANDSNSICQLKKKICSCRKLYSRKRGKCVKVKRLGESCSNSEECKKGDQYSRCTLIQGNQYSICECLADYPYLNEKCQKKSHYTESCTDNSNCIAADPNTLCISIGFADSRSCMCALGYIYSTLVNRCVYESNNILPPKKSPDTASLTAIIGTVTCVGVLLISLFLCAYRQRRESQLRSRAFQAQATGEIEEALTPRDSTLRRSIRSFLTRIGQAPPYTDPPPPYDLVVAQKAAINNQDNPPSYNDIFQTSQEYTNRAFIPDPGPSHNI